MLLESTSVLGLKEKHLTGVEMISVDLDEQTISNVYKLSHAVYLAMLSSLCKTYYPEESFISFSRIIKCLSNESVPCQPNKVPPLI